MRLPAAAAQPGPDDTSVVLPDEAATPAPEISAAAPDNEASSSHGGKTTKTGKAGKAGKDGKDAALSRNPDRVFLANAKDAIPIRANSAEMFVLAHLRDEAHRFAVTFHRNQRRRRTLRSALSDIEGIGDHRRRELLRHFGSVRKVREASVEDMCAVPGMTRKAAEAVRRYFDAHGELAPVLTTATAEEPTTAESGGVVTTNDAEGDEDAVEDAFAETEAEAV